MTNYSLILFILVFFCSKSPLFAQDSLSTVVDSIPTLVEKTDTVVKKKWLKNYFKEGYPSPKKAVVLGIVPGMGQIYNKKYWKLPLVYGALGGVIYSINFNTINYKRYQNSLAVRENPLCQDTASNIYDTILKECADQFHNLPVNTVRARRNSFDKSKQLSWIGVFAFYLISAGDAFVDAHLKDFSVDDDISFRPILNTDFQNQPVLGFGVYIPLSK